MCDTQLDKLLERHNKLTHKLAGLVSPDERMALFQEYAELSPLAEDIKALNKARAEYTDLQELADSSISDPELHVLALEEAKGVLGRLADLERAIAARLMPADPDDDRNIILEIRAGTGGEEAALFAADLVRMYRRYAEIRGWRSELAAWHETELGGVKEAILDVSGRSVFRRLKFESGVHRVQRVPRTEASGRIHTSAATVAVLPEAEEIEVDISEKDLRIDTYRSQGAGGQHVNTTDSAVRITHIPTNTVVTCQDEKSQHKNKMRAMKWLRARIYDYERQKRVRERAETRRELIGGGDRSERVRTYNFPQQRVTDHRIDLTLRKLDRILSGEALDEIVEALIAADQQRSLSKPSGLFLKESI